MTNFMIVFNWTDANGYHIDALFPNNYEQALKIIGYLTSGLNANAELYIYTKNEKDQSASYKPFGSMKKE